jgi:hypothetical protein
MKHQKPMDEAVAFSSDPWLLHQQESGRATSFNE